MAFGSKVEDRVHTSHSLFRIFRIGNIALNESNAIADIFEVRVIKKKIDPTS
jgi:hypothetical protein